MFYATNLIRQSSIKIFKVIKKVGIKTFSSELYGIYGIVLYYLPLPINITNVPAYLTLKVLSGYVIIPIEEVNRRMGKLKYNRGKWIIS